tara:strand:- start:51087 stop:51731 length:645 start_codon:yes stop_codon:yes gene_type:complete
MARDFNDAYVILWVDLKRIARGHADGVITHDIEESEWNSVIMPAITGSWHIPDVDQLNRLYFWENPDSYAVEKTDYTGVLPRHYNESKPESLSEAKKVAKVARDLVDKYQKAKEDEDEAVAKQIAQETADLEAFSLKYAGVPMSIAEVRSERKLKLKRCDWTQLPDCQLSDEDKAKWRSYRQQLRDFPSLLDDPYNPDTWPGFPVSPDDPNFVA